ncbi:MAG: DUF4445 domain-containing protein [Christensenellaceae bacterium]|nr:DUF4445 domain-containing protein [Christensenellaceae bacterium]
MSFIVLVTDTGTKELSFCENESVFDVLVKNEINIGAACGGKGRCGKCGALLDPAPEPAAADRKFFSEEELKNGMRLTCLVKPENGMKVKTVGAGDKGFEALGADRSDKADTLGDMYIAIDIGTTTVALCLTDKDGNIAASAAGVNAQRIYGADVISRITASIEGKGEELEKLIKDLLLEKIGELAANVDKERIKRVVISGNTTMGHLFMGLECNSLGVFPFTPVDISLMKLSFKEAFNSDLLSCEVVLLPGISTYVGADIVSGMLYCDMDSSEDINLFVDLGTNGEMAIGKKGSFLVSSTAAGPAFEGGNISCGTGSIPGAICSVDIEDGKVSYKTIGDAPAAGICGTGAVESVAALIKGGLMDETGMLDEDIFDDGFVIADDISFTQKDVREMQLAKSAVRAGLETLIIRYNTDYDHIKNLYVAGGFGHKLDVNKAAMIGMFPNELIDKIVTVGNSSLLGAIEFAKTGDDKRLEKIVLDSREIGLSEDKDFSDLYIENMYFDV